MDKKIKLEKLKHDLNKVKSDISNLGMHLKRNQEKIRAKDLDMRRIKSNLQIRERELFELHNYRRLEENKKMKLGSDLKRLDHEITELTRQINREKISR